eukprot:TRINITY_DN12907_c0_g1_i2.p1 TRINITY_DN12907_c0_g1~~TRINITY_DN12907_c0_g1_i2.p1  ORF type:complete len:175 (-),score=4.58 TRINITY_DN12907_c0_g1_i2:15-539(-)
MDLASPGATSWPGNKRETWTCGIQVLINRQRSVTRSTFSAFNFFHLTLHFAHHAAHAAGGCLDIFCPSCRNRITYADTTAVSQLDDPQTAEGLFTLCELREAATIRCVLSLSFRISVPAEPAWQTIVFHADPNTCSVVKLLQWTLSEGACPTDTSFGGPPQLLHHAFHTVDGTY